VLDEEDSHPAEKPPARAIVKRLFASLQKPKAGRALSGKLPSAMQNLRDKLLKAGLVTQDQIKEAEKPKPAPRPAPAKKAQPAQGESPAHGGPQPKGGLPARLSEEERQRREAFALHDAEVAELRRKDAAKAAEARMQSERARTLRALVAEHKLQGTLGEVAFHYVKRSGKIGKLALTAEIAQLLERGDAAVVEDPGQPECVVVPAKAAETFYKVDAKSIRFWAGPQKPLGFEDVGATEAS
jgi:uncharacterized protein YaiL (DUF2058 family)